MKVEKLSFSAPFCDCMLVLDANNFTIDTPSIVVNANNRLVDIDGHFCKPWKSVTCSNVKITGGDFLIFPLKHPTSSLSPLCKSNSITNSWEHVYDVFRVEGLQSIRLWRSAKDCSIPGIELNLWYAPEGTDCGIHNTHDFLELHTQIFGLGIMQKFSTSKHESLTHEIFMPVGFTHDPFCQSDVIYPWHQYKCVTDCIWLAIEFHNLREIPSNILSTK